MKKRILFIVGIVAVLVSIIIYIPGYLKERHNNSLIISGRVEADEIVLSPRIAGRLTDVLISDGVKVEKGQVIARLDRRELVTLIEQLKARIGGLEAKLNAEEQTVQYLNEKIKKGIEHAERQLQVAKARLAQAQARFERQKSKYERYKKLANRGVFPSDRLEDIKLSFYLSEKELNVSKEMLREAEITLQEAEIEKKRIYIKLQTVKSIKSEIQSLKEKLKQAQVQLSYTEIRAPAKGIVLRKVSEPGEVIGAGGVIGIMIVPESVYVKTYLPERFLGRVKVGTEVKIVTDAYPDKPIYGRVCYISDRAEFTPKEVQSKTERVKQVFATKICFKDDVSKILKKGMPVDVEIDIDSLS